MQSLRDLDSKLGESSIIALIDHYSWSPGQRSPRVVQVRHLIIIFTIWVTINIILKNTVPPLGGRLVEVLIILLDPFIAQLGTKIAHGNIYTSLVGPGNLLILQVIRGTAKPET